MARIILLAAGLGLAMALAACARDTDPLLCGELAAGDLVITEVRGGVRDAHGEWIELYNASGAPIELQGLALTVESISGADRDRVLLRRAHTVAAGGHAVLGRFDDATRPAHVDVGWGTTPPVKRTGAITITCGQVVDRIGYEDELPDPSQVEDVPPDDPAGPNKGTYALGVSPPSATANDDAGNWCADATETRGPCGAQACLDLYQGSPGGPNPACPP